MWPWLLWGLPWQSTKNKSGNASNSPWTPLLELSPNGIAVAGSCCQGQVQKLSEVGPCGKSLAAWSYVCTQSQCGTHISSLSFWGSLKSQWFLLCCTPLAMMCLPLAKVASQPVKVWVPETVKQNNCFLFTSWWSQASAVVLANLKKRLGL